MTWHSPLTLEEGEVTVSVDNGSSDLPVVSLPTPDRGSAVDFASLNTKPVAHVLLSLCVRKFCKRALSKEEIELMWALMDVVYDRGLAWSATRELFFLGLVHSEVFEEVFLMGYQLCLQGRSPPEDEYSPMCYLLACAIERGRSDLFSLAASYCTQGQLHGMISLIEQEPEVLSCQSPKAWQEVMSVFREEQVSRTLQQEVVLSVLRNVGGNPRKAQLLTELPQPLLDKFRVPFKNLYDKL